MRRIGTMVEDKIKFEFIRRTLEQSAETIRKNIKEGIRYNQYEGDGTMDESVKTEVSKPDYAEGVLDIHIIGYGRIQDIWATRKQKQLNDDSGTKKKRRTSIRDNQYTGERKGFYTKSIYKELDTLIGRLSFGFTEEVIEGIKKTINTL